MTWIPVLMFPALFLLVFSGIPVSFSLIITSVGFALYAFGDFAFLQLYGAVHTTSSNFTLAAIPLFVLMGAVLERTGIALKLFQALQLWFGHMPGGLAVATIAMCAIFAAASGVVGAVEIVVGMMAIPAMKRAGYNMSLTAGAICAGGSLGTIIPPSIVVVIYASIAQLSIGRLFAAIIIPGVLMVVFFLIYIVVRCWLRPEDGPPLNASEQNVPLQEKLLITAKALVPPLALIAAVLGSLLGGIASPTEAAAVGALGTFLLAIAMGQLSKQMLFEAFGVTLRVTCMIMLIVVGGTMFTSIFAVTGGGGMVRDLVSLLGLNAFGTIALFLAIVFIAGFVLDWISIVLVCVPIFSPVVKALGIDPIWFAVLVMIVIQSSYLTPPMAPSIFYLRSIAPSSMTYNDMYRGVMPFVLAQIAVLLAVLLFPSAATYLPSIMVGL